MPPTRRRQANVKGGRTVEHRVMVTLDQETQLAARADALGVTIPKLLVDAALGSPVATNKVVMAELAGIRRRMQELAEGMASDVGFARINEQIDAATKGLGRA